MAGFLQGRFPLRPQGTCFEYNYLFDYEESQNSLEKILDQLLSCNYFKDGWKEAVIELIDWIDMWNHTIDPNFSPNLFKEITESIYIIKDMYSENSQNPPRPVILLKHIDDNKYSVVQGGSLCNCNYENASKQVVIQDCYGYIIAKRIKELFTIIDLWLEESGSEIILDPHYYVIK